MGSAERAKVICTGPRTWPQLTPVDMTAPKVRTSKKFWQIQARALSTLSALPLALLLALGVSASSASFVGGTDGLVGLAVCLLQDRLFLDVDVVRRLRAFSPAARSCAACASTPHRSSGRGRSRRRCGHVAGVGVAVGVAVPHVKEQHEIEAAGDGVLMFCSPWGWSVVDSGRSSS